MTSEFRTIVGFTGPRLGMTDAQKALVRRALLTWIEQGLAPVGLHGDCIGADAEFHQICREIGIAVYKRPSNYTETVANTDAEMPEGVVPKRPYARNREIAFHSDRMIACPPTFEPIERSGTWYTLQYAAKRKKRVTIVFPDGTTRVENA